MADEKLTKRQIQAQNTQQRVYKYAIELMKKKGFENITIEEICKTAGVSIGTFYNYFSSKNDILNEIFKHADDYFLNEVSTKLNESNSLDNIVKFFYYYANYNKGRTLGFVKHLYNAQNQLFVTKGRHMQSVLQRVIEEGQKNGEITRDMTAEETVKFLFIAARGVVYDWCLHDGEYDLEECMVNYFKKLIRTIAC